MSRFWKIATITLAISITLTFLCAGMIIIVPRIALNVSVTPQPTTTYRPRQARLCCVTCAEEGMLINLWEHPADNPMGGFISERGAIVGQAPHDAIAIVWGEEWIAGEDRYYYYVYVGDQKGWIPESFVQFGPEPCPAQDKVR
jgi:hypothetical protein